MLQLSLGRKADAPQHILVLALRSLLLEIGRQGIALMAQIGIDQIGTTCQLITPSQQTNNPPANLRFGNLEFNLSLFLNDQLLEGQTFEPPLVLTIDYDPALLGGLNAETLELWYWEGTAWSTEGIAILSNDVANHTVTLSLSHFSVASGRAVAVPKRRIGSPPTGCSTFSTSAPNSPRMEAV